MLVRKGTAMPMSIVEKLDAFYDYSMEATLDPSEREELTGILTSAKTVCEKVLEEETPEKEDFSRDRQLKVLRLKSLLTEELSEVAKPNSDVLCHWAVIREFLSREKIFCQAA